MKTIDEDIRSGNLKPVSYTHLELDVTYDDTLYQLDLEYFDTILASFSIDAEQVSEQHIVNNFREGRTLSAILDTDTLWQLDGYDYGLMQMPELSDCLLYTSRCV